MSAQNSIRRLLIISLIALSITPVILLSGILSWQSYMVQEIQAKDIQRIQSMLSLEKIISYIHEQEVALGSAVKTFDFINMHHKERNLMLAKLLSSPGDFQHRDIYDSITLLDSKGKELESVSRSLYLTKADLGERSGADEFKIPAASNKTYFSPVYFNDQTGEPYLKISVPITDLRTMRLKGVLVAEIRMNYMWDVIADVHVGETGSAYLLDQNGRVIAHPNPSIVLRGTYFKVPDKPGITTGLRGNKVVLDAEKINFGEQLFYIVTELPVPEAFRYTYRSLIATIVLLLLTLSCAIFLGYVLIRKIIRPIESLAGTAHAISKGDFSQKAKYFSDNEIGILSGSFNEMTSKLLETIDSLKQQMAERRQAEEQIIRQNELMNNILNSMTHPFYVIDANDYIVKLANPAARFGVLTGNVTCYVLTHHRSEPCSDARHPCVIKKIKETGGPVTVEHVHYDGEGNTIVNEIHGYPIFDSSGNIVQVIEYNLDITERKRAEEELRKHREHLQELVNERTAELSASNAWLHQEIIEHKRAEERKAELLKELESVNQELRDFAYIVSHDLKAPLRAISTLASWIATDYRDRLDAEGRQQLDLMIQRVKRMHNLINGILEYSRVGRIKEKTEEVNVNDLVKEVLEMIAPPENITVTVENELPTIVCEKTRIMEVFQNLLSNAIKFMDKPKGIIRIGCVADDGYWKFSVTDNGPGIEEEYFEKIFQMFQTLSSGRQENTGVGLTLVKKIITMYGGNVWVESEVGQGSTFYFTIPK